MSKGTLLASQNREIKGFLGHLSHSVRADAFQNDDNSLMSRQSNCSTLIEENTINYCDSHKE